MQKWNIADLINLKCEERNEYNSWCASAAGRYAPRMLT
jgi:hypothetical protein